MNVVDVLGAERKAVIGGELASCGRVRSAELAARFGVSEDTVRRDLREMAAAGLCRRVYGGALPPAPDGGTLAARARHGVERKAALAAAMAAAVPAGALVFLDAGSTNLAAARLLPAGATVATNAPAIAAALAERDDVETLVIGGRLDARTGACLGAAAMRAAARLRPDVMLLGVCGLDAEAGITAHVAEDAELKAALTARSARVFVAATSDKLGTAAPFAVAPATFVTTLFAEGDADAAKLAAFAALGVEVVRADAAR